MLPDWIPPGNFVITPEVIALFENNRNLFVKIIEYFTKRENKPFFITIDTLKTIDDKILSDLISPIITAYNPKYIQKSLCHQKRKNCTIAIAQLDFENEDKFPFKLINEKGISEKIERLFNFLRTYNIDILCFPELCTSKKIVTDIFLNQDKKIPIVIGGSFYDGNFNSCPIIIDYLGKKEIVIQEKINLSKWEDSCFPQKAMCKGRMINIISTDYGNMSVLLCLDGLVETNNLLQFCSDNAIDLDLVFIISKTRDTVEFHNKMHELATRNRKYCIFANSATFGRSGLYTPLDREFHDEKLDAYRYPSCTDDKSKCIILKPNEERVMIFNLEIHEKAEYHPTKIVGQYSNVRLIADKKWEVG